MTDIREVLIYFVRLGILGFGGPLAIISQIQQDLIVRGKWLPEEDFRRALSLIKSMPGPVGFQTVVFVASQRTNVFIGTLAGFLYVLPSFFMMVGLAAFYSDFAVHGWIRSLLQGMQAGALVIIAIALKDITKSYLPRVRFWIFMVVSGIFLVQFQLSEPFVILGMGLASVLFVKIQTPSTQLKSVSLELFLICLKAGSLAFGTGLAIIPLLQSSFVREGWLTTNQFMDAVAFGQLTPGPVVISVTFLGYKVAGWSGALISTAAIFLPSWFHMTTWFPRVQRWMSQQKWIFDFVLGATAALAAGILVVVFQLGKSFSLAELATPILLSLIFFKKKIPGWALVLASGLVLLVAHGFSN